MINIKKFKKSSLGVVCPNCKDKLKVASGKMLEVIISSSNKRTNLRVSSIICEDCLKNKIDDVKEYLVK